MSGDLIDRLVADLKPVARHAVGLRILAGTGGGLAVTAVLMLAWLGPRPDLMPAMATPFFWIKFAYTILLVLVGVVAMARISRPDGDAVRPGWAMIAILAAIAVLAAIQFLGAPGDARRPLLLGSTAVVCPWNIVALSVPVLAGTFWAMRGLAPTHLTLAGAVGGLAAGAVGAWVYSFHCDESAIPFVAIWYTLGIVIAGAIGAVLGRLILRW
jgi:hypothetical protein